MRRILALLFVLATLTVVPAVPATAHEHRVEVTVVTEEVAVSMTEDATTTVGTYALLFGGVVVGEGTVYGVYNNRGTGVHGTRHFVDGATGEETFTQVKVLVVGIDDSGDPVVIDYAFTEDIIAQTEGTTGHGVGVATGSFYADGTFVLETTLHAILEPGG